MAEAVGRLGPPRIKAECARRQSPEALCRALDVRPARIEPMGEDDWLVIAWDGRMHVVSRGSAAKIARLARLPILADVAVQRPVPGERGQVALRRDLFAKAALCTTKEGALAASARAALIDLGARMGAAAMAQDAVWRELSAAAAGLAGRSGAPVWARAVIETLARDAERALARGPLVPSFGEAVPNNLIFSPTGDVSVLNPHDAGPAPAGFDLASAILWSLEQHGREGASGWAAALSAARSRPQTARWLDRVLPALPDLMALRCLWLLRKRCAAGAALDPAAVTRFLEFSLGARIEAAAIGHAWQTGRGTA